MQKDSVVSGWWVYLIRTASDSLYCGVTNDIERRFREHCADGPRTAKALRGRGPLQLVFTYPAVDKQQAMQLEWQIKQWPKVQKEALVAGHFDLPASADGNQKKTIGTSESKIKGCS